MGQLPIDSTCDGRYAQWLLNAGEYEEYKFEVKKLLNFCPDNDSFKIDLLKLYRIQGQYDSSLYYFEKLFPVLRSDQKDLMVLKLHLLSINSNPEEVNKILSGTNPLTQSEEQEFYLSNMILQKQWKRSIEKYDSMNHVSEIKKFEPIIQEIKCPYKSSLLATSMSVIIPGSGKIYSGRLRDGMMTFMLIGLYSWQSYVGFHKRDVKSVYGWINLGLAGGFYLGNIYGSGKAAKIYNKLKNEKIKALLYDYHQYSLP